MFFEQAGELTTDPALALPGGVNSPAFRLPPADLARGGLTPYFLALGAPASSPPSLVGWDRIFIHAGLRGAAPRAVADLGCGSSGKGGPGSSGSDGGGSSSGINASPFTTALTLCAGPELTNPAGGMHGGAIASIIDVAASAALVAKGRSPSSTSAIIVSYLNGITAGTTIRAEARVLGSGGGGSESRQALVRALHFFHRPPYMCSPFLYPCVKVNAAAAN